MVDEATEKQREMQEKLKNMSPEELRDFQKQNCIFCHIIKGDTPSKKVYEDDKVLGILDINPANPGHILLLPKEHYAILPQMPDEIVKYMGMISKQLSRSLIKALKLDGTTIFIANGGVAGQKAQHFMLHIIPRKEGDGIGLEIKPKSSISIEDQMKIKPMLHQKILASLGIPQSKDAGYDDDNPSGDNDNGQESHKSHEKEEEVEIQKPRSAMKAESKVREQEEESQEDKESDLDDVMSALGATFEGAEEEPEVEGLDEEPEIKKDEKKNPAKAPKEEDKEDYDGDAYEEGAYDKDEYDEDDSKGDETYEDAERVVSHDKISHPEEPEPEEEPEDIDEEEIDEVRSALGEEEEKDNEKKKRGVDLDDISSLFG